MKTILLFWFVVGLALAEDYYDSKFDNLNVQEVVQNDRLLKSFALCFLDQGPCTSEGKEIKKFVPEGVKMKCEKCSPSQKDKVRTIIKAFRQNLPDLWQQFQNKYDPKQEHDAELNEFLNATD